MVRLQNKRQQYLFRKNLTDSELLVCYKKNSLNNELIVWVACQHEVSTCVFMRNLGIYQLIEIDSHYDSKKSMKVLKKIKLTLVFLVNKYYYNQNDSIIIDLINRQGYNRLDLCIWWKNIWKILKGKVYYGQASDICVNISCN